MQPPGQGPHSQSTRVVFAYTIPYVVFLPFYGRLGDPLGLQRLVLVGILVYAAGTIVYMGAPGLGLLVAARIVHGADAAGANPLSLAIISREVAVEDMGRAISPPLRASAVSCRVITGHAALLFTMRFGGRLADVWSRRWAVVIGLGGQTAMMATLALLPSATIVTLLVPMVMHGAFAGLSLASLHHVALHEIPDENRGVGAGTYSMSRFVGSLLGASVMGVALEGGLASAGVWRFSSHPYAWGMEARPRVLG